MKTKRFMSKTLTTVLSAALLGSTLFTLPTNAAEQTILNSNFENGTDGWTARGNCVINPASWTKHNGNNSLYIGNRQTSSTGAAYNLNGKAQAGGTYNVSAYFMSWQIYNDIQVKITLSYKDKYGRIQYAPVANATAGCGEWKGLNGTFTVPTEANEPVIYFETSDRNCDLYVDDVKITQVSGGSQTPAEPQPQPQPTGSTDDYMKNMKIDTLCPNDILNKRPGVAYGTFQHKTYYSKTTGCVRGFNLLLPANYNPQKKYPVLYFLHGIFGNENSMLDTGIDRILANHVADGNAKEMIVVLPNMFAAPEGSEPSFTDEGVKGYDNFVNDLTNDLMPYIESNYSVATGRDNTAIAGFSMGGRETLFIGVTRADKFGYVGAMCPAPGVTPGRDGMMNHKGQLQESQFKVTNHAYDPYVLMIAAGTNDGVVGRFPKSYDQILTRNGQNHIYYEVPGGAHDNTSIRSGLNNFVRAIFKAK
ncbi:MAG: hypothetical protein E7214_02545 [Clostridium sp.]|nr:hypothetical protein [Clostridium sp.]